MATQKCSQDRQRLINRISLDIVRRLRGEVIEVGVSAGWHQVGDIVRFNNRSWRIGSEGVKKPYDVYTYTLIPLNIFN